MSGNVYCSACKWVEDERDEPDLMKCPLCGRPTLRRVTFWEFQREDLWKVLKFVVFAGSFVWFWFWLTFPYGPDGSRYPEVAYLKVSSAGVHETPRGVVATFLVLNESNYHFAKLNLELRFQGHSAGPGQVTPFKGQYAKNLVDLTANGERRFDVELGTGHAADFSGWNAKVTSFSLPPGYWNRRLQQAISVRIAGQSQLGGTVPSPFDEPHPPAGLHRAAGIDLRPRP